MRVLRCDELGIELSGSSSVFFFSFYDANMRAITCDNNLQNVSDSASARIDAAGKTARDEHPNENQTHVISVIAAMSSSH